MTNTAKQDCHDVIIIGSGLSGVTAARYLTSKGKNCLILDKGRRIGGRCSTKRKDGMTFNHGAQFFTAKHEEFIEVVGTALQHNAISEWDFGHHNKAFIGAPTMRDFIAYLAKELDVRQEVKITSLHKDGDLYQLCDEQGERYFAHHVIVTIPAPQAADLLKDTHPELADTARTASYDPCWTVMLGLDEACDVMPKPLRDKGDVGWAAYEPARIAGGIYQPAITIQATPEASRKMLDWQAEEVIEALSQSLFEAVGRPLPIRLSLAHRWLYARVAVSADNNLPFISDDGKIVLAGDYFGTARLETAYLSGQRAALCLLG